MSYTKWSYDPEKCDGSYCPGNCDECDKGNIVNANMLNKILKKCPIPEGGHIFMVKDHGRRQQKELLEKFRQLETLLKGK